MSSVFCCTQAKPYKPRRLLHENIFDRFLVWTQESSDSNATSSTFDVQTALNNGSSHAFQVVHQVNFGPLESKRYFLSTDSSEYQEISESDLINANYKKLNSYKNFKCTAHNKFIEVNVYEKNPVNEHHWRANIARPAGDIDLKW